MPHCNSICYSLCNSQLSDVGAEALGNGLKRNKTLTELRYVAQGVQCLTKLSHMYSACLVATRIVRRGTWYKLVKYQMQGLLH